MLDKQSLLLRKASFTTVLGVVATVVWMMVANVGLRGGENAAVDSAAGMISQAVAVALFTMPLVVFAIVHLYVSEEQENGIWGVIRARNGKIGHLLAFRLSSAILFLVVWALGYVGTLGALVAFHYSLADVFYVIPMFFGLLISVISTVFTVASVHLRLGGLVPAATAALALSVVGVSLIGKTTLALAALPMGGLISGNPFKDVDVTQPLLGYEPNPDSTFGLGLSLVAAILVALSLFGYLKNQLGKEK
ncbi:hypothetical protein ACPV6E_08865 [Corynebacterium propinquum]|uniref:hypothetical protein n=1 Tax=Corynebacterium propinquum TaxID=43769 RepID=UPI0011A1C122|nr:hypothetical protein [Corynebacterium propinquum]WKS33538.1 hypothetical protein NLL50_07405 [Corynebacterium propinquum]WKS40012.1 hypothetical protein NLL41_07405 [Corynebacterium propinquum]WKS49816.1 hypothetical protein NLL32_02755 [Corynebacterium propinquum]